MKKALAFAIISATLFGCGGEKSLEDQLKEKQTELSDLQKEIRELEDQLPKREKVKTPVSVASVNTRSFVSFFESQGVVQTDRNVMVVPEASGIIKSIKVSEGQKVRKGQVLAVLDAEMIADQVAEVQKSLELAREMFEKQEALRKANVGTEVQYLQAKNQKESLEQRLQTLRTQQRKAVVVAPIGGTVEQILPKVGEMASPQSPFMRLVGLSGMYVETDVSEAYLGKIKAGDEVKVDFPYLDGQPSLTATVSYVGNFINPGNRTFQVQAKLKPTDLPVLPNLLAVINFQEKAIDNALAIPEKVVMSDQKGKFVYVVDDKNIAHKKPLELGVSYKGEVVVKEGLTAGDRLVVKGQSSLVDGKEVSVH